MSSNPQNYVSAFDGARDFYELPLALQEAGLLERHVSDFYVPDFLMPLVSRVASKVRNRHRTGLPSSKVDVAIPVLAEHAFQRFGSRKAFDEIYPEVCRKLSLHAAESARRTDAAVFLYSEFAYWAFEQLQDRPRLLFQFHPHFSSVYDLLASDVEQHPEVRWSFYNEDDSRPLGHHPPERLDEWMLADKIACASSFTKRSLVAQGCSADRIHVVPYGADRLPTHPTERASRDLCRVLFIGQGVQRKGLHHLLKAWARLRPKNAELTVVARRVDPGIRPLLDQPKVKFIPGVGDADLLQILGASDVFVMPSIVEGFGLVYLEALNSGLHTLGTENTGLPDLGLSHNAVTLVRPGDVAGLCDKLESVIRRSLSGDIDPNAIQAEIATRTWAHFRRQLVDFCREPRT